MSKTIKSLDISLSLTKRWEQGFLDQYGNFYNREDALNIVIKSKQPFNAVRNYSKTELFSEGLY